VTHPPLDSPDYRSTRWRAPRRAPLPLPLGLTETTGPTGPFPRQAGADLTAGHAGPPLGQRIVVHGRVTDVSGRPLTGILVEVWQANAAGRYRHDADQWDAPLDPNFTGGGCTLTDDDGRYRFLTVRPGAYPWANHDNAWRPAHIHFSVLGARFTERLVTQMYFPDDPLLGLDPIFCAVPAPARDRLVARFDLSATEPSWALGYRWDIVLGSDA
jgi:protocatechuate 3,4-dioxygenase beta subunit